MKREGKYKIIQPPQSERGLDNAELMNKYGISRITAWRFRTGRINSFLVRKKKVFSLKDWQISFLADPKNYKILEGKLKTPNALDYISEAKVRICEYGTKAETTDELMGHWYKTSLLWLYGRKSSAHRVN